jgi:hypothetical protein
MAGHQRRAGKRGAAPDVGTGDPRPAVPPSTLLPPATQSEPVHAYAEELCWRAALGEVMNTFRLVQNTPGDVGYAFRSFLLQRTQVFLKHRNAFHIAEDPQIRRFITRAIKKMKAGQL